MNNKLKTGILIGGAVVIIGLLIYMMSNSDNGNHMKDRSKEVDNGKEVDNNVVVNSISKLDSKISKTLIASPPKISNITFYIENSASMFGYVHGASEYVDVLTELAQMPKFVKVGAQYNFNFINGGKEIKVTPIGNNYQQLGNKLNIKGMKCGNPKESNLNKMFQIALEKASGGHISILISDGIYDIDNTTDPSKELMIKGKTTRTMFINKLYKSNIETILIKLSSNFNGQYYHVSKTGSTKINQKRPYYVWIFGDANLLNKYFNEEYISSLNGYIAMVRYLKMKVTKTPYIATAEGRIGSFRFDHKVKNKLTDIEMDKHGKGFGFSIAVDLSKIPFSDNYKKNINNYRSSGTYYITKISQANKMIIMKAGFQATHIIYIETQKSPYGKLIIKFNNNLPSWINSTNIDHDIKIIGDEIHTVGFNYLTKGINDAYQNFATEKNLITEFTIDITK